MKSKKRQAQLAAKRIKRKANAAHPGGKSKYGRKAEFLRNNGGSGLDYPDKPWR